MHNGTVGAFPLIRTGMLQAMSAEATQHIAGTTDSEHLAMLFFTYLARRSNVRGPSVYEIQHPLKDVKAALEEAIKTVIQLQREVLEQAAQGDGHVADIEPSSLNVAITDGGQLLVIRFHNHPTEHPPSLYFSTTAGATLNRKYPGHPDAGHPLNDASRMGSTDVQKRNHGQHIIVASEPTTYKKDEWQLVGKNECLMVAEDMDVVRVPVQV
jgi:glutamine amidotransferase